MSRWTLSAIACPMSAIASFLTLAGAAPAAAQGWVEPPPHVRGYPVVRLETDVRVRVTDRVAQVEVTEWFENRGGIVAEGDYLYPLPGEAVFSGFSLWQGDLELRGEILDAGEARAIYESIVRRRADPALIELAGSGLLRARVFPIEPGDKRKVTLRYTQVLERAGDALHFRYAAGKGGAGNVFPEPRPPIPWHGGRGFPDLSMRQDRPEGDTTSMDRPDSPLRLELVAEREGRFLAPFSPTHPVRHSRRDGRLVVEVEGELRGKLSLFLPLAREGVGLALATHRVPGEDGYFMLTLSPGRGEASAEPRDLTVVLDVSGSMSGEKMEQARSAVLGLLETLAPRDRFRLVAFSNRVRPESEGWRAARPDELREAAEWVERLQADGGTAIADALDEAFRLESSEGRLPIVVFVTDGLPTVGERSPQRIAERVEGVRSRARVFAFGVGHDVDAHLLDRLSAASRGTTTYVEPGENVARALELMAAKVRHPVLTDLALERAPVRLLEVYPVTLPDLFAGEELVLFGRYRGDADAGELRLRGRRGGREAAY
ncbi:MAG TPA: VIT domain-containing protein, partial [Candidatus Thermoplasmatota archaeon]